MVEYWLLVAITAGLVLFFCLLVVMKKKNKAAGSKYLCLQEKIQQVGKVGTAARVARGAAHDFNNELMCICSAAECLKERLNDAELARYCNIIIGGCEQASHLARQMTQLSGGIEKPAEPINLNVCLGESLDLLSHGVGKEMRIVRDFGAESLFVAICGHHLQSLILNLGFNARDAVAGSGTITVVLRKVWLTEDDIRQNLIPVAVGEYAEICFTDDGPGIDAENMKRIFEPFFTTKGDGKGTGLGLSEVYDVVLSVGGTIRVENRSRGVCFRIFLPLIDVEEKADKNVACAQLSAKVLIVDDDPLQCRLLGDILSAIGCEISVVDGAQKAMDLFQRAFAPDVVLLDVVLPNGGGKLVYEKMRYQNQKQRIVFMSGGNQDAEIAEILEKDSYTAFLSKPCRVAQVVETLQFLLAKA